MVYVEVGGTSEPLQIEAALPPFDTLMLYIFPNSPNILLSDNTTDLKLESNRLKTTFYVNLTSDSIEGESYTISYEINSTQADIFELNTYSLEIIAKANNTR